jgi:uncharacterized protein (DUF1697 family)
MAVEAASRGKPSVHIALLRGINVGGKNLLSMERLADLFAAIGCRHVRTYIQSGNVIFEASPALARRVPRAVSDAIAAATQLEVPVLVRTAAELKAVVRGHPFWKPNLDAKTLHVAFLADAPPAERVAALDHRRSPPDDFVVRGREIYLRFPNGVARSRLTNAYFDGKLATVSTLRGLGTVEKLVALASERAESGE